MKNSPTNEEIEVVPVQKVLDILQQWVANLASLKDFNSWDADCIAKLLTARRALLDGVDYINDEGGFDARLNSLPSAAVTTVGETAMPPDSRVDSQKSPADYSLQKLHEEYIKAELLKDLNLAEYQSISKLRDLMDQRVHALLNNDTKQLKELFPQIMEELKQWVVIARAPG